MQVLSYLDRLEVHLIIYVSSIRVEEKINFFFFRWCGLFTHSSTSFIHKRKGKLYKRFHFCQNCLIDLKFSMLSYFFVVTPNLNLRGVTFLTCLRPWLCQGVVSRGCKTLSREEQTPRGVYQTPLILLGRVDTSAFCTPQF